MINRLKIKSIGIVLSAMFFCIGCVGTKESQQQQRNIDRSTVVTQYYNIPKQVNKIIVSGGSAPVELVEAGDTHRSLAMKVTGYKVDVDKYYVKVSDHKLYIQAPDSTYAGTNVRVLVDAQTLKYLEIKDSAKVISKDLCVENLNVTTYGHGSLELHGRIGLKNIFQHGSGDVNIEWVDSDKLSLTSDDEGHVHLAGVANTLFARLTDHAVLDARYLRTRDAFIFATNAAQADVLTVNRFNAYAEKHSNVYYYKRPKYMNIVTRDSGNVLQLHTMP